METIAVVIVGITLSLTVASGIWVAIALVRAVSCPPAGSSDEVSRDQKH